LFARYSYSYAYQMAREAEDGQDDGGEDKDPSAVRNGKPEHKTENGRHEEEEEEEEEDEDEEPRLKYASLTKHLKPIYRNGDATSAFLVAGDKMVSGESCSSRE